MEGKFVRPVLQRMGFCISSCYYSFELGPLDLTSYVFTHVEFYSILVKTYANNYM